MKRYILQARMMPETIIIIKKNLKAICNRKGITISELAKEIKVARPNIYEALDRPHRFKPTVRKIEAFLGGKIG